MQWKRVLGSAVVLGAVAGSAPLAAQTAAPKASPTAIVSDTSWASARQQMSQRFRRDMNELAATTKLAHGSPCLQVRVRVIGVNANTVAFEIREVVNSLNAKSCLVIIRSQRPGM